MNGNREETAEPMTDSPKQRPLVWKIFWIVLVLSVLSALLWLPWGRGEARDGEESERSAPPRPFIEHVSYRKTSEFDPGTVRAFLHNPTGESLRVKKVYLDDLPISVWGVDMDWKEAEPDPPPSAESHDDVGEYEETARRLSDRRLIWARLSPGVLPAGGVGEFTAKLTNALPRPMKLRFELWEGEPLEALVRPVAPPLAITSITFSGDLRRIYVYLAAGLELPEGKGGCGCGGSAKEPPEADEKEAPAEPVHLTGLGLNGRPVSGGLWLSSEVVRKGEKQLAVIELEKPLKRGSCVTVRAESREGHSAQERVRVFSDFPLSVEHGKAPEGFGLDPGVYTYTPGYAQKADPPQELEDLPPTPHVNYVFDCAMHKFGGDKRRCARETFRRYEICARLDPANPSLIHMCRIRPETGYALFGETTDVLRINPNITSGMSEGQEGERPEEEVARITRYAVAGARPRPVQSLADTGRFGRSREPAGPEELRRRTYTIVGSGVKGLLYRHYGWKKPGAEPLNNEIRRMNAELAIARPYLRVADVAPVAGVAAGAEKLTSHALLAGDEAIVLVLVSHVPAEEAPEAKVNVYIPAWAAFESATRITPAGPAPAQAHLSGDGRLTVIPGLKSVAEIYLIRLARRSR